MNYRIESQLLIETPVINDRNYEPYRTPRYSYTEETSITVIKSGKIHASETETNSVIVSSWIIFEISEIQENR